MAQQSPFDRLHVEQAAESPVSDLLDQLNLPPALADFLRKNKKAVWSVVGVTVAIVTVISLYGSYAEYQHNKASSALTAALQVDDKDKKELLELVIQEYGSTPSALWGKVELAHLAVRQGKLDEAMELLVAVNKKVKAADPLKPLLLLKLAALGENGGHLEKALAYHKELTTFKSFEADAYQAMGRIYELQENTVSALEMYEKYLQLTDEKEGVSSGNDQFRAIVQTRVNHLKK